MRIGIDYRLLSSGRSAVHRGMGRYTQQQLREVLRLDERNEYVLFCREDTDRSAILPEIAGAPNVSIALLPPLAGRRGEHLNRPQHFLAAAAELERAVEERGLDLFHATTPGRLDDLVPPRWDACPLVATHYDLIPLIYPDKYFHAAVDPNLWHDYHRALRLVRGADRLIAISGHVRREAVEYLGVPAERIDVAWPVADPCFRQLPEDERERVLAPLRARCGLEGGFVLAVSHLHHAKNLPALLDAWRLLPAAVRRAFPLVLACDLEPGDAATVRAWAEERGIADGLVLTGFVADEELVALYNAAAVFVHPSRYEGFGLPVLEAMKCGAPVIAGNASSLPEVVGGAGLLFDPEDPADLARAITTLAGDAGLRRELGEKALARAAGFRPEDLGRATLAAYEKTLTPSPSPATPSPPPRERGERLHLALFTPVPPQKSGIADYSAELLREMVGWADVELFVDDGIAPQPGLFELAPVYPFRELERRMARRRFDAILYQMGASFFHLYMVESILKHPGIITFHDLTWGFVLHRLRSLCGDAAELPLEVAASDGEGAAQALRLAEAGPPEGLAARLEELFDHTPVLRTLVAASRAQILHMPRAAEELARRYPEARPFAFPMGVEDPRRSLPASGWNGAPARFGIPAGAFLIGLFGVADPVKRIESVLRALARVAGELPEAFVAVVGAFYDPGYQERLRRLAAELGIEGRVLFTGRVAESDFDLLLLASDAVVNLRFPFRQQMSATLMRAVAAGKPVIVTDVAEWRFLPASFHFRVAPDDGEVEALAACLLCLGRDPEARRGMGAAARAYWQENATPAHMAAGYRRVLEELTA
jgi:glycosyltransferase involved in cell wall biosynthesis